MFISESILANDWHPTKNIGLDSTKITTGSAKFIWWRCSKNLLHEWKSEVWIRYKRVQSGKNRTGCPYCANLAVNITNCLATTHPQTAKEWNSIRNGNLTPKDVVSGSPSKVWWKCGKCEYEWESQIRWRTKRKGGCPACNNRVTTPNNCLSFTRPDISNQWHIALNKNLTPEQVTVESTKRVWWQCPKNPDHIWDQKVRSRKVYGCPFCDHKRVLASESISVTHSDVAKEWHPTKNGTILPTQITYGHDKKVWWLCSKNPEHEWQATVYNRIIAESGCPYCWHLSYTKLEQFVENQLGIKKFNEAIFSGLKIRPDFKLSDSIYFNADGLYWHSNRFRNHRYHHELRELFESHNLRLLQFYEDEIYNRWDIVHSIINASLGGINLKYSARDCVVKEVTPYDASRFYIENHLLGTTTMPSLALEQDSIIVAMMSVQMKKTGIMDIVRFVCAKNSVVRGGFSKLMAVWIKRHRPQRVTSLCDLRYSTGKSYELLGFKRTKVILGWSWVKGLKRFNWQYCVEGNGKTEADRAVELGVSKLYDAGKAKYVLAV